MEEVVEDIRRIAAKISKCEEDLSELAILISPLHMLEETKIISDDQIKTLERYRQEKAVLQKEKAALQEEKAALQKEKAALQEEKAALQKEKAALRERDTLLLRRELDKSIENAGRSLLLLSIT